MKKSESDSNENTDNEVSLMLVKVGNWSSRDSAIFHSETKELSPWFVFTENPLSKLAVNDVIRIYMDVGEESNGVSDEDEEDDVSRFIYGSPLTDNLPDTDSMSSASSGGANDEEETSQVETVFTLCFRSITCDTFPFLSKDVAASLVSIVGHSGRATAELYEFASECGRLETMPGQAQKAAKKRAAPGGREP
ncbi:hypothetical protein V7S43_015245 [Phytophthora oleae]|uniref:Uncharacterized protein n=1 Tax=Phytophthora oleae TaxID=2107226 RepID=A0ABD3F4C1_9STRA